MAARGWPCITGVVAEGGGKQGSGGLSKGVAWEKKERKSEKMEGEKRKEREKTKGLGFNLEFIVCRVFHKKLSLKFALTSLRIGMDSGFSWMLLSPKLFPQLYHFPHNTLTIGMTLFLNSFTFINNPYWLYL